MVGPMHQAVRRPCAQAIYGGLSTSFLAAARSACLGFDMRPRPKQPAPRVSDLALPAMTSPFFLNRMYQVSNRLNEDLKRLNWPL